MAPTFLFINELRFYIQSNEETRKHVHVEDKSNHKAKFWLEPKIELSVNYGFKEHQLTKIITIITQHETEFKEKWDYHFC
jgi:hypothetical protein